MLFTINKDIMEKWRWTSPRLYILISIIKKYEEKLEKGNLVVFKTEELKNNFGYTPDKNIRYKSFVKQINSDISLLDPYKLNGGRLVFGIMKIKDRKSNVEEVYFKYIKEEAEEDDKTKLSEAKIHDAHKTQNPIGSKFKPFYGPIENDRIESKVKAKTSAGSDLEIDLISLPENIRKQIRDKINQ